MARSRDDQAQLDALDDQAPLDELDELDKLRIALNAIPAEAVPDRVAANRTLEAARRRARALADPAVPPRRRRRRRGPTHART